MEEKGCGKYVKKNSLKKDGGSFPWFSCNGFLAEPRKCSANINLKIGDLFVNEMWSETVVDKLLDALCAQHLALENAYADLDAERDASAVAVDDALNMIARLQQEKSSLTLEHTSYYRETQQRLAFAQQKFSYYEELLEKKNEEIRFLEDEIQAYRERCMLLRPEEENNDRDVDFLSTSLTWSAPLGNVDALNGADFDNLLSNDFNNRYLPSPYCSGNFELDCSESKAQTSHSENNSSENYQYNNNSNRLDQKDAQDICRNDCNKSNSSKVLTRTDMFEQQFIKACGLEGASRCATCNEMQLDKLPKEENVSVMPNHKNPLCNVCKYSSCSGPDSVESSDSESLHEHFDDNLHTESGAPPVKSPDTFNSTCSSNTEYNDEDEKVKRTPRGQDLFITKNGKLFGDLQYKQKPVSEELEDALIAYICSLKQGTKEQRSELFSQFYRAAQEAAREEYIANCLNSHHGKRGPPDWRHSRTIPSPWRHGHDWFSEMCVKDNGFTENKIADSPPDLRIKELKMRICALENNSRSLKRAINFLKQNKNQISPPACNTHNNILRMLTLLAGLAVASSVKDTFSKACIAVWGVCSFLLFGSQQSSKRS